MFWTLSHPNYIHHYVRVYLCCLHLTADYRKIIFSTQEGTVLGCWVLRNFQQYFSYITNLVCYTYFHWLFNPECTTVLSLKIAFNLVKIHLLFRVMILIQWSVNISVFVNHVVIVFWCPNEGDQKRTYIPRTGNVYTTFTSDASQSTSELGFKMYMISGKDFCEYIYIAEENRRLLENIWM
jgi:hypothetical protein